jgi:hypothetical protein
MQKYVVTYGIACVEEDDGIKELISQIPDVSTNLKEVEQLVTLCNEQQLSPIHLQDVVDDLLATV